MPTFEWNLVKRFYKNIIIIVKSGYIVQYHYACEFIMFKRILFNCVVLIEWIFKFSVLFYFQ